MGVAVVDVDRGNRANNAQVCRWTSSGTERPERVANKGSKKIGGDLVVRQASPGNAMTKKERPLTKRTCARDLSSGAVDRLQRLSEWKQTDRQRNSVA